MSSATNENRGHLENEFQRRMHDAEASPAPDLWARIDHDLTTQESKHYKNRMVQYRQLAAACFVLFMLAGAMLTYHYKVEDATDAAIATMQLGQNPAAELAETAQEPAQSIKESIKAPLASDAPMASHAAATASPRTADEINTINTPNTAITANTGNTQSKYGQGTVVANAVAGTTGSQSITDGSNTAASITPAEQNIQFDTAKPFYQTARQAIAAVPPAFKNDAAQTSADNPSPARSVVALNKATTAKTEEAAPKTAELTLALHTPGETESEKSNGAEGSKRWSIGLAYAPSYFDQNIQMPGQMMGTVAKHSLLPGGPDKSTFSADNMNEAKDEFETNTDPAFSYAAEVKAGFNVFKKLKLLAGVGFTQNMAKTKSSYIVKQFLYKPGTNERVEMPGTTVFLPSLNNNFTTDSLSVAKTDNFYVNYRYRHVTVPVGLQYEGNISKSWFWYAAGGMAANFLVETTVMASNNEVQDVSYKFEDEESPFRKVQFSGNVSAGVGKRLSNAISVTAGPEFRGYFNSLLAEPEKALAPQGNPYTIGVNMSVNYNLGHK